MSRAVSAERTKFKSPAFRAARKVGHSQLHRRNSALPSEVARRYHARVRSAANPAGGVAQALVHAPAVRRAAAAPSAQQTVVLHRLCPNDVPPETVPPLVNITLPKYPESL